MKPLTYFLFKLADDSFSEFFTNSINFYSLALGKHHFRNEHRCGISVSNYRFSKFYTEEREVVKNDDRRVGMLPVRVTWGTSLVVQWVGLHASTAVWGGGGARVCSLIWELVCRTLLSVLKENRITWGTLKHLHSPRQKKKTCSASHSEMSIEFACQHGPDFLYPPGLQMNLMCSQRWEIFPSECHCNNTGSAF